MKLHWRWLFPALIFGGMTLPLLLLAFDNDEHMAGVFHRYATWWAIALHVAILLFPLAIAFLPEDDKFLSERRVAWGVWGCAMLLALVGNVVGSVAYATGRTAFEVLNGQPTGAGWLLQAVAAAGGFLVVALEFAAGRLVESNVRRLVFGYSPPPSPDAPTVKVDAPRRALRQASRRQLSAGERQPPARRGVLAGERQAVNRQPSRRQVDTTPSRRPSRRQVDSPVDSSLDASAMGEQELDTLIIPAGLDPELAQAVIWYAQSGAGRPSKSYRYAAHLSRRAGEPVSHQAIKNRVDAARALAPDWVALVLGEGK